MMMEAVPTAAAPERIQFIRSQLQVRQGRIDGIDRCSQIQFFQVGAHLREIIRHRLQVIHDTRYILTQHLIQLTGRHL